MDTGKELQVVGLLEQINYSMQDDLENKIKIDDFIFEEKGAQSYLDRESKIKNDTKTEIYMENIDGFVSNIFQEDTDPFVRQKNESVFNSEDGKYACYICQYQTAHKDNLLLHIQSVREGGNLDEVVSNVYQENSKIGVTKPFETVVKMKMANMQATNVSISQCVNIFFHYISKPSMEVKYITVTNVEMYILIEEI